MLYVLVVLVEQYVVQVLYICSAVHVGHVRLDDGFQALDADAVVDLSLVEVNKPCVITYITSVIIIITTVQ